MGGVNPVAAGAVAFVLYVLLVALVWRVNKVDYLAIAETRESVVRGIVVPIGLGLVLLVVITTALGWWGDVMTQDRRGPSWALIVPVLFGITALLGTIRIDWRSDGARLLPLIGVGVLLVGVAEELLSRGLLVVGPQRGGWSLLGVWLFSTVLFALLHVINGFFGVPAAAVPLQLVSTFLAGTALFVILFTTGSLVIAMLLHALWDFSTLGSTATKRQLAPWQFGLTLVTFVAGLAGVWAVLQ